MKIKLFYFYETGFVFDESERIQVLSYDVRGEYQGNRVFLQELEVDVPDVQAPTKEYVSSQLIASLNKEKSAILAETHKKVSEIEDKIQQLLCIELQPNGD